jgi:hypothetical protein
LKVFSIYYDDNIAILFHAGTVIGNENTVEEDALKAWYKKYPHHQNCKYFKVREEKFILIE